MVLSDQFSILHQFSQEEQSMRIRIFSGNKVKGLLSENNDIIHSASKREKRPPVLRDQGWCKLL